MSNRDPLVNLIDYVNTVKPYHTKIYEVLLQYVYDEPVAVSIKESYQIYTTLTTPEANKWIICDGVGWDTTPYGVGLWDYPYQCSSVNPSKVYATVTEKLQTFIDMFPIEERIFGYVQDRVGNLGWDTTRWDWTGWDSNNIEPLIEVTVTKDVSPNASEEPVGATITESLTIQII
jgi:hypothetical protein